jgi:NAD(P)-dependent dehydrogenase (short-subunit alcohol dehydrogenase family)
MPLKEANVLIVGGSSGIGLGAAEAILKESAHVTIASRSPKKLQAYGRPYAYLSTAQLCPAHQGEEQMAKNQTED